LRQTEKKRGSVDTDANEKTQQIIITELSEKAEKAYEKADVAVSKKSKEVVVIKAEAK